MKIEYINHRIGDTIYRVHVSTDGESVSILDCVGFERDGRGYHVNTVFGDAIVNLIRCNREAVEAIKSSLQKTEAVA